MRLLALTPVMGLVVGLAGALALGGCHTGSLQTEKDGTTVEAQLDARRPVLIAVPRDGGHGGRTSIGSGPLAAQLMAAAFSKHAPRVDLAAANVNDEEVLLEAARRNGSGYLVMFAIASWEQRAAKSSGRPGRSVIAIAIFDVASGQEIRSTILDSASPLITLIRTSTEPGMFGWFVDSLYGARGAG